MQISPIIDTVLGNWKILVQSFLVPILGSLIFILIRSLQQKYTSGLDGLATLANLNFGALLALIWDDSWRTAFSPVFAQHLFSLLLVFGLASIVLFAFLLKWESRLNRYNAVVMLTATAPHLAGIVGAQPFPYIYWTLSWFCVGAMTVLDILLFVAR